MSKMNCLSSLLLLSILLMFNVHGFTVRPSVGPSRMNVPLSLSSSEPVFVSMEEEGGDADDGYLLEMVDRLRSNAIFTAGKILMAWEGHEFKSKFKNIYDCELTDCVIDMREWLDPLTSDNPEGEGCLIDLEPLRRQLAQDPDDSSPFADKPKELFLPTSIYVRQEMKGIFNLFCLDIGSASSDTPCIVKPDEKKTILLGSPGVGKSILCFLAALYRSQSTVTIYIRQTSISGEKVSVFIMFPEIDSSDSGKVRCLFTRRLEDLSSTTGLLDLKKFLQKNLHLYRKEYFLILDGPRYNDRNQDATLNGDFDYLCTSAGYPAFKDEEEDNSRQWCLNGWTHDEAEAAFVRMHGNTDEVRRKAREAHALCGGKIRQMCSAFNNYEKMRVALIDSVDNLKEDQVKFSLYSNSKSEMNKIRIVFRKNREDYASPGVMQYVDSKFLWKLLYQKLGVDKLVDDYKVAEGIDMRSMAGWHFENTVHAWFSELITGQQEQGKIITSASMFPATSDQNDDQLIKVRNQYWVPPSRFFRNIDSAVVIDRTLYAFQVTVRDKHDFNVSTFYDDFLGTMKALEITSVEVCVITTQSAFAIGPYRSYVKKEILLSKSPDNLKHFGDIKNVSRDGWFHTVDMRSAASFRQSMDRLLVAIREREHRKRSTSTTANYFDGSNAASAASPEGPVSL